MTVLLSKAFNHTTAFLLAVMYVGQVDATLTQEEGNNKEDV